MKNIIGYRIKESRLLRKLSQEELAQLAGFQTSAISHFETGRRDPSAANLVRLCNALAVSADYLLGRTSEPVPTGSAVEQLLSDFGRMTTEDQASFRKFARMLAEKSGRPQGKRN
jgi:transcriptional regulator with XRE-family HTH domain